MLFPEELEGKVATAVTGHNDKLTVELEEVGPRMDRFIHNLDTDEEIPDSMTKSVSRRRSSVQRTKRGETGGPGKMADRRSSRAKGLNPTVPNQRSHMQSGWRRPVNALYLRLRETKTPAQMTGQKDVTVQHVRLLAKVFLQRSSKTSRR